MSFPTILSASDCARLARNWQNPAQGIPSPVRLRAVAREDADGDGADNETELLLGRNPGDARDAPTKSELSAARKIRSEFATFLASYRWRPFDPVQRPAVPKTADSRWV
jgi:hypothetical protein